MGITNQIPSSRLIQPGVIDNAAARPASPFEGQVIFQKDTDQLLVWNGTAWVIPNQKTTNPTGLEKITPSSVSGTGTTIDANGDVIVATGGTTITVNGAFSTNYRHYIIFLSNVTGTGQTDVYFNLGTTLTGTSHRSLQITGSISTSSLTVGGNSGTTRWPGGLVVRTSTAGNSQITLSNPFEAIPTRYLAQGYDNELSSYTRWVQGNHTGSTSFTDFHLTLDAGNFSTAVLSIYGYRNS
jgi:hypothetical protein